MMPGAPQGGDPNSSAMPPAGAPPGGMVDPAMVMQYFEQVVTSLIQSGMRQEDAMTRAMQMVGDKFGPEVAQQLMLAAQGGGGSAPAAPGPDMMGGGAPPPPQMMG